MADGRQSGCPSFSREKDEKNLILDYAFETLNQSNLGYRVSRNRILFCLCEIIIFSYCLNELRQNFQLLVFSFDGSISLSSSLSLLFSWPFKPFGLSSPSPTPAYYNLFQYSSLWTQMERQKSLFENIFYFSWPCLSIDGPTLQKHSLFHFCVLKSLGPICLRY